jgi:hypothetical protein
MFQFQIAWRCNVRSVLIVIWELLRDGLQFMYVSRTNSGAGFPTVHGVRHWNETRGLPDAEGQRCLWGVWALGQLWLFWLAPVVGGALAWVIYHGLFAEGPQETARAAQRALTALPKMIFRQSRSGVPTKDCVPPLRPPTTGLRRTQNANWQLQLN